MGNSKLNKPSKTGFFRRLFRKKSAQKRSAVVDDKSKTEKVDKRNVGLDQQSRKSKNSLKSSGAIEQSPPSGHDPVVDEKSESRSLTQKTVDKGDQSMQHSPEKAFPHADNVEKKKVEDQPETDEHQVGSTKFVKVNAPKRPAVTKLRQYKPKTPKTSVISYNQKISGLLSGENRTIEKTDQMDKSKNKSAEGISRSAIGPHVGPVISEKPHICNESVKEISALKEQVYALSVRLTKQENDLQCQAQELAALKLKLRGAHHTLSSDSDDATSGTPTLGRKPVTQSKIPVLNNVAATKPSEKPSPAVERLKRVGTLKMTSRREEVQQQRSAQKSISRIPAIKPAPSSSTRLY